MDELTRGDLLDSAKVVEENPNDYTAKASIIYSEVMADYFGDRSDVDTKAIVEGAFFVAASLKELLNMADFGIGMIPTEVLLSFCASVVGGSAVYAKDALLKEENADV